MIRTHFTIRVAALTLAITAAWPVHAATEIAYRVSYEYDELGRVIRERHVDPIDDSDVVVATYAYDDEGRLTKSSDANGRTTELVYDALGRVVTSLDAAGKTTEFKYDVGDRLVEVQDPRGLYTRYAYDGFGQLWRLESPDTGVTTFEYSESGLRTKMTRNDGSVTAYAYDGVGRIIQAKAGSAERNFSYDGCTSGKGRLCVAELREDGTVKNWAAHVYNPQGWLAQRWDGGVDEAGQSYEGVIAYAYDGMGRITGINYPSGVSVGYGYNAGRIAAMTATVNGTTQTVIRNLTFEPFGAANGWTYGNGIERLYHYDKNGRPYAISAGTGNSLVQSLTYGFNVADEISAITNGLDASLNRNYQYDALGRLSADTHSGYNWEFDASGNHNRFTTTAGGLTTYIIDDTSNRVDGYTSGSVTHSYGYDALGNRISESGTSLAAAYFYDGFNRLRRATINGTTSSYIVNALDQRVVKTMTTGATRFVYAGQNQMLAEHGPGGWKSYLWLGSELVGVITPDLALHYVHGDHLGRPEAVTNSAKQMVWQAKNISPYGGRTVAVDQIGGLNIGLPGQYLDIESGLWHNGFRDYDASIGRYVQSDPLGLAGGINTYAYASGNPVSSVDPLGLLDQSHRPPGRPPRLPTDSVREILYRHANEMQAKNWIGADKFYHCMAMCEAGSRGEEEAAIAGLAGELRELNQQYRHGDPKEECDADRAANNTGLQAGLAGKNCSNACAGYKPLGMPYP